MEFQKKNGVFSVRSTYKMMVATKFRIEAWIDENAGSSNLWQDESSLWKIQVPGKIKMFLWWLTKHYLPMNDTSVPHEYVHDERLQTMWNGRFLETFINRVLNVTLYMGTGRRWTSRTYDLNDRTECETGDVHDDGVNVSWSFCKSCSDPMGYMVGETESNTWRGVSESSNVTSPDY